MRCNARRLVQGLLLSFEAVVVTTWMLGPADKTYPLPPLRMRNLIVIGACWLVGRLILQRQPSTALMIALKTAFTTVILYVVILHRRAGCEGEPTGEVWYAADIAFMGMAFAAIAVIHFLVAYVDKRVAAMTAGSDLNNQQSGEKAGMR